MSNKYLSKINFTLFLVILLLISQSYSLATASSVGADTNLDLNSVKPEDLDNKITSETLESQRSIANQLSSIKSSDDNTSAIADVYPVNEAIESNTITSEVHSPGRDSYIVDFGFSQIYEFSKTISKSGFLGSIELTPTVSFEIGLSIPVNITMTYNPSIQAGESSNIRVDLYEVETGITLYLDVDISIPGSYKLLLGTLTSFTIPVFQHRFDFFQAQLPLSPIPLKTFPIPIPIGFLPGIGTVIDTIFDFNLNIIPTFDVDVSADLYSNNPDTILDSSSILFEEAGTQGFDISTDEFAEQITSSEFGLTNFNLDFNLGVLWQLAVKFAHILSFLGGVTFNLLTYPSKINFASLSTDGDTAGFIDVTGSSKSPNFIIDSYSLDDGSNSILEPSDTATIGVDLTNYGYGAAAQANITTLSNDVTITETKSTWNKVSSKDGIVSHTFDVSVASNYAFRNATIYIQIDWESTNGTLFTEYEELVLRVLQSGDAYLNIDNYSQIEPNDGEWDRGETINIHMDISKSGNADIDYAEVFFYDTDLTGFSAPTSYVSKYGPFDTWSITGLDLTSSTDFVESKLTVLTYVAYNLTDGTVYYDGWLLTFDLTPPAPVEDLANVWGSLVDGVDDAIFQAGETFELSADIENLGNAASGVVIGIFTTNSTDLFLENAFLTWDSHNPGQTASSTNSVQLYISEFTENSTIEFSLFLIYETPGGDLVIEEFKVNITVVALPPPTLTLNYYDIFNGDGTSSLAANKTSLITVDIGISEGPGYGAIGTLGTNDSNVQMINDTSYYGTLYPGQTSSGDGFVVFIPANYPGGTIRFTVNVTVLSSTGEEYIRQGYFDIVVEAGDILTPLYYAEWTSSFKQGQQGTIIVNTYDESGIDSVFLIYYNYSTDDWSHMQMPAINSSAYQVNILAGNDGDFLFAFVVFDNAFNYDGAGLDEEPLSITLEVDDEPSTPTTTPPDSTSPDSTPVSTPDETSPANSEPADTNGFSLFLSVFAILPIVITRVVRNRKAT